ncbi:MAG: hypothetical protein MH204_07385 [Fimbriimonadaceae bacterium]|nr:hypothetical protein [Fimbriimonadaceae bacterium]
MDRLHHVSDVDGIRVFEPRAPLRHPDAPARVWLIDREHLPLYLLPRECPRVAVFPVSGTSEADRAGFGRDCALRMMILIDRTWEEAWRTGSLVRYDFKLGPPALATGDHGVWVSESSMSPIGEVRLDDLPAEARRAGVEVRVVDDLVAEADRLWPESNEAPPISLHVSMMRMSNLPGWTRGKGRPTGT